MPAVTNTSPSTMTPSATTSTSPQKKFNTISANPTTGNGVGLTARASIKGLFESSRGSSQVVSKDDADAAAMLATTSSTSARLPKLGADAAASVSREDGPWSVSVAALPLTTTEKRDLLRKKSRQSGVQQYTLYVTTPTHNLTLTRSAVELLELDNRLREGRPDATTTLPKLPNLPQPSATGITTSRSKFLQTISRTLSPSGHKNRAAANSNQLGAAGTALMETKNADNVPLSGSNTALTSSATSKASPMGSTPTVSAPISPTSEEPPNLGNSKEHSVTTNLATYLTTAANLAFVKRHKAWKRFINVGSDDLQSVRVERRIRKIRSDLAKHVKSAVAPANVNVAATPSHSDIGEEGGRTDDDRSFSGRSTSHSFRNDRQDLSGRSASSDNDKAARDETRKSKSFAGIPEESERQASLEGQGDVGGGDAASSSRSPNAKDKGERRHRRRTDEKVTVDDFDMIRVLGKGCAGKVLLVRHKPTKGLFAMKSIHKRHVLAHQELQHTLTEQAVLKRMAKEVMDPFVVKLWWSFHDVNNLYLVMDFHPGGDLATQLSRWGRLGRDRARFYAAEIVEGVEGLHRAGVIYRDLKPENVLIGVDGHIVLSDFGLSKEFPVRNIGDISNGGSSTPPPTSQGTGGGGGGIKGGRGSHWMSASDDARSTGSPNSSTDAFSTSGRSKSRWADERDVTTTFCGTAEYLAPEVIQGSAYSYEVDWWSFGTMLYEMLTGITPFWADTHADMYVRVLHDDLVFPDDRVLDQDTKSILRGLLQRNPMLRMKEPRIKKHPYFSMIEWDHVFHKRYIPPYIPPINPLDETDTQNFDETFLDMKPVVNGGDDEDEEEGSEDAVAVSSTVDKDVTSNNKAGNAKDTADVSALISRSASDGKSLFDGYSFRGRKDSGSIRSSIFSSEPSEHPQAEGGKGTDSGGARQRAESDDDNAAALAAVAALDHLEREAAASEAALSSPSQMSNSTRPTSVKGSDDLVKSTPDTPTKSTNKGGGGGGATIGLLARPSSTAGQPATIAEAEREDEDDEWDIIDAPAADESYPTEANGGKGQNLFARGVVDTYRLLRRQESSRLPLGASYSGRTLNRLSRRQQSSPRDRSKVARESGGGSGQQTNGTANRSVASLGSRGGNEATPQALVDDESSMSFAHTTMNSNPSLSGIASNLTPLEETRRKGASPSLASSDEQTSNEKLVNKQRIKKMKRFTNFFETSR